MQQLLDNWEEDFQAFHARFAPLFARRETQEQARKYLRGLMARVERKNCWQLAEALGEPRPDATQRLLYQARWDADEVRDRLQQFVIETCGDPQGILVVDETGFVKKGQRSVGVKRQYSGTAGKIENCQVGVFLSYVSSQGQVFLDRRLYLPQDWCEDPTRRQRARVPEEIEFRSKPELGLEMVQQARQRGVPARWVTADEIYGEAGFFRQQVAEAGLGYVLAVPVNTPVWVRRPRLEPPQQKTGGRPRRKTRLAPQAQPARRVGALVAGWGPRRWTRLEVAPGEKGPRVYDWARQRVVESQQGLPGRTVWLLARRAVGQPSELAYYLCHAPRGTALVTMAQVAAARWGIEQGFQEAKGQTGLDQYQVRFWHSWYRHITLSLLAHAWLASVRWRQGGKRGR